jgi:ubiquinone/menaquinone biosynthesis C-methylase UbiE
MIEKQALYERKFKLDVEQFKKWIIERSVGNYTKSYETYKRVQNIIASFMQETKKNKNFKVLDIGCGNGYHIFLLNTLKGIEEKVYFEGLDISEEDIEFAREVKESFGFDNIKFKLCDAESVEYPDNHFDIVLCSDVLEHLVRPEKCLSEIMRVLKLGGLAIITTPNKSNMVRIFRRKNISSISNFKKKNVHISLKGLAEWLKIVRKTGFIVKGIKRGALIFGGNRYNSHPILFAFIMIVDRILNILPFGKFFAEAFTLQLRKSKLG